MLPECGSRMRAGPRGMRARVYAREFRPRHAKDRFEWIYLHLGFICTSLPPPSSLEKGFLFSMKYSDAFSSIRLYTIIDTFRNLNNEYRAIYM